MEFYHEWDKGNHDGVKEKAECRELLGGSLGGREKGIYDWAVILIAVYEVAVLLCAGGGGEQCLKHYI